MVLSSADIFFQTQFFVVIFLKKNSVISVECQAVWIQIMPVGADLGPNCLQRLSADALVSKEFMATIQANGRQKSVFSLDYSIRTTRSK